MVSFTQAFVGTAALLGLVQFCPAPFAAIPVVVSIELGSAAAWAGAAGGIVGGAAGAATAIENANKRKRDALDAPDTPIKRQSYGNAQDWELCHTELGSSTVTYSAHQAGSVLVEGLPASCMNLATVITGQFNEGNPVPMSSSSIQFNNIPSDTINEIVQALQARGD